MKSQILRYLRGGVVEEEVRRIAREEMAARWPVFKPSSRRNWGAGYHRQCGRRSQGSQEEGKITMSLAALGCDPI